jgi:hypothetical protein
MRVGQGVLIGSALGNELSSSGNREQTGGIVRLLDPRERRIVVALQLDGRSSWRRIAEVLDEPERTVARRGGELTIGNISASPPSSQSPPEPDRQISLPQHWRIIAPMARQDENRPV